MSSPSLRSLCYVSSARRRLGPEGLATLLEKSREANARSGITGLLMHCAGNFMQVLEGPADAVHDTMARIRRSELHNDVIQMFDEPLEAREFEGWSMACRSMAQPQLMAMLDAKQSLRHMLLLDFWASCR